MRVLLAGWAAFAAIMLSYDIANGRLVPAGIWLASLICVVWAVSLIGEGDGDDLDRQ